MTAPRYINRELSWLEFNQRVLEEARNPTVPLLERLRFLAITSSNLDEFFMVRVGGLQMLVASAIAKPDPAGLTPAQQLEAVDQRTRRMVEEQYACYRDELEPELTRSGTHRVRPQELSELQTRYVEHYFAGEVFSVATPMAVGSQTVPLLANRALHVAVRLKPPSEADDHARFAIIPIGRKMSRFITLSGSGSYEYILLEDLICMFIDRFFPGEPVVECAAFRITRNADLGIREDLAHDFLSEMEGVLDERKRSDCVRLEVDQAATKTLVSFLQKALAIQDTQVHRIQGPLDLGAFVKLVDRPGIDPLKYEPWPPQPSPDIDPKAGMFKAISEKSLLLYHPYESFDPVLRLIQEAAEDPDVLAIKQVLYRTSRNSPVVAALVRAAELGKYVTAIVELRARFDEERDIEWARTLEESGAQVIYGVKGLKTHAKLLIIVRREPEGLKRYLHFGTGNYNEITAQIYSDASYMTCDPDLGADASTFFNTITGYSQPQKFRKLEAAPIGLREKILDLIQSEAERKRQGQKAHIMVKINSLVDSEMIEALYAASQAGVKVQLNVRGICCLCPGVPKLSDNISVVSIVDRFLEHARILYFHQGGQEKVFISSADWMPRNLDRRVELLVPVDDPVCRRRLIAVLETYFKDNVKSRALLPDGRYERIQPGPRKPAFRSQEALAREAREAIEQARHSKPTVFEAYRASSEGA